MEDNIRIWWRVAEHTVCGPRRWLDNVRYWIWCRAASRPSTTTRDDDPFDDAYRLARRHRAGATADFRTSSGRRQVQMSELSHLVIDRVTTLDVYVTTGLDVFLTTCSDECLQTETLDRLRRWSVDVSLRHMTRMICDSYESNEINKICIQELHLHIGLDPIRTNNVNQKMTISLYYVIAICNTMTLSTIGLTRCAGVGCDGALQVR